MTTSGTTSFNLELDELFDEAYGRVGIGTARSGNHLKTARRNLNILLSEWDNRGVHLWKVKLATIPLVLGQAEYNYTTDPTNYPNDINETPGSGFSSSSTPSNYQLRFYYLARIEDGGRYTNTPDVVFRFLPCLTSGLAYYLSITYRPEKTEMLKLIYEDELQRALQEDGQRTSLFISPKTFYGDGV